MLPLWHIAVLTWLLAAWLVAPLATPRPGGASLARVEIDHHATVESGARDRILVDDVEDDDATWAARWAAPAASGADASPSRRFDCSYDGTNLWPAAMPRGPPVDLA